jgi:cytochrome d ubiquinol oxidase subunit II
VLGALYLPVALMLVGLVLRGVAFDFRVKDAARQAAVDPGVHGRLVPGVAAQGWMLGRYVTGLAEGWGATLFAAAIAVACRRPMCCWAPAGWC